MRSLKIAGLCLAVMLGMGIATAGSAFAGPPLWLLCLKRAVKTGTFKDSNCKEEGGEKEWRSEGVTTSDTVRIRALTILLEDSEAGPGKEKSIIRCNHSEENRGEGLLITEKLAIINEAKVENPKVNCERESGPCNAGEIEKVEGANLPWEQIIFETEKKTLGELRPGKAGAGEPGWAVTCKVSILTVTDTCTSANNESKPFEALELFNEVTTTSKILLVRGVFENRAHGNCSQASGGAKGTANIYGLVAILLPSGAGLSINLTI